MEIYTYKNLPPQDKSWREYINKQTEPKFLNILKSNSAESASAGFSLIVMIF